MAKKKAEDIELSDDADEVELDLTLPWEGEKPKRPVIPFMGHRLVFKAQLAGDEYAEALLAMGDVKLRYKFLKVAIVPESADALDELLDEPEEGLGAVAQTGMVTALARHYGIVSKGADSPDPSKSAPQRSSRRNRQSGG